MVRVLLCCFLALLTIPVYAQGPVFRWARQIGGSLPLDFSLGQGLAVDMQGHVYNTGVFKGTIDFDPGPGTYPMTDDWGAAYILKTDQNGDFLWARRIASHSPAATAIGYKTVVAPDGNIIVSGQFSERTAIDTGTSGAYVLSGMGGIDVFVLKFTPEGKLLWARSISGPDNESLGGTAVDQSGNILVSGFFKSTVDFDPGPGVSTLTAKSIDAFILKLNASGNLVWVRQMVGKAGASSIVNSLATDSAGNIYAAGSYSDSVDFDPGPAVAALYPVGSTDMFVEKLDPSGRLVWVQSIGGPDVENTYSICVDRANNLFFTGRFTGTIDFDPGPGRQELICTPGGYPDIFLAKLDNGGRLVWAKSMGGAYSDWGKCVVPDHAGNIFLSGDFANTVDFDPGPGVFTLSSPDVGVSDAFICKFDTAGNFIWAGAMSGKETQHGETITTNNFGLIYTTGSFQFTVDFDPGPGTHIFTANSSDIFLQQLGRCNLKANVEKSGTILRQKDKATTYQWVSCPDYTPISGAHGQSYVPERTGSYAVIITNGGCTDTSGCIPVTLGIDEAAAAARFQVRPNPAGSTITIAAALWLQNASIQLLNYMGEIVLTQQELSGNQWEIAIDNLAPGLYFVQLLVPGQDADVRKLIKY